VSHRSADARVVLDLYACEPNPELAQRGLFSARKKKLVSWTELYECLDAYARQGTRGIKRLRADLDLYSRIGCPESTFEKAIRRLLMDAGLPEPELQHPACGGRYRIDVAYPQWKVGIEGRSKAHHFTDQAFESDPVRDADLAIAGWIIIHVTWAQIRDDPEGVVVRIRRALSRRGGVAA
jgi:very-short-patch-repair endonuclease